MDDKDIITIESEGSEYKLPVSEIDNFINNSWPIILIFVIVVSVIRLFSLHSHNQKIVLYKEFFSLVFIIYLLLLFELVSNTDMQSYGNNFVPFREIFRYELFSVSFYRNVVGNIIIFIPYGVFIVYFIRKCSLIKGSFIILLTSYAIELIQSRIGRSYDVDDIILNFIGGIIGFIIGKLLIVIVKKIPKSFKNETFLNILAILLLIILFLLLLNHLNLLELF